MRNSGVGKYAGKVHCEQSQYNFGYLGTKAQCAPKFSHDEQMLPE